MRYKLRQRDFFSDMELGLKMLAKRKLDLKPSKVEDQDQIRCCVSHRWSSGVLGRVLAKTEF